MNHLLPEYQHNVNLNIKRSYITTCFYVNVRTTPNKTAVTISNLVRFYLQHIKQYYFYITFSTFSCASSSLREYKQTRLMYSAAKTVAFQYNGVRKLGLVYLGLIATMYFHRQSNIAHGSNRVLFSLYVQTMYVAMYSLPLSSSGPLYDFP